MPEESTLQVPQFKKAATTEELIHQIAVVGEAIEKCERILQHLAISNFGDISSDMDAYMCKHIELTSMKNNLSKQLQNMTQKTTPSNPQATTKEKTKFQKFWAKIFHPDI